MVIVTDVPMSPEEAERRVRFGKALEAAIERKRTTQGRLAEALDVNQTTVSSWKRGVKRPRYRDEVERIEEWLGPEACAPGSLVAILYGSPAEEGAAASPAALSGISIPDDLTEEERAAIETTLAGIRARRAARRRK